MIPSNIQREHIIEAISDIDKNGVPIRRGSTKYSLEYDCKCYPPKYVVSLANKYANGVEWESENFSGGEESNHFLEQRGFCIIEKQTLIEIKTRSRIVDKISIDIIKTSSTRNHKASCFACKNSIFKLLTTTFGEITIKKPIKFPTHLKNHEDRNYYDALSRIYNALCEVNGSERFERQNLLREADYYSVEQNRIIEIDESQHFTYARKVTLENYPDYLVLGFSRERWIKQCEKLNIRDSEENRDVKRAWYDTLRDFAPLIENYAPTIRIMTGQYKYCTLQHTNHDDVSAFHREIDYCISEDESKKEHVNNTSSQALVTENVMLLLQNTAHIEVISCHSVAPDYKTDTCSNTNDEIQKKRTSDYFIEVRSDPTPKIGTIVFTWDWNPTISEAKRVLEDISSMNIYKTKYLIACGGFIACRRNLGIQFGDVKNPPARTTDVFISVAMEIVHDLLDASIRADLQNITRCISLGVDIVDSYSGYQMQLVIMSDLTTYKDYITGKSYPTGAEEKTLLPITDYGSHFVTIDDDKILILGCHDLNVFSRRAEANAKGHRTITQKRFKDLVALHLPNIVLQHPHTTDSTRTWLQGINGLLSFDQPIQHFASAGRYYNRYGDCRSTLDSILLSTKKGCVQNIVISNA